MYTFIALLNGVQWYNNVIWKVNVNIHVNRYVYLVQTLYEHTCTGIENSSKEKINIMKI